MNKYALIKNGEVDNLVIWDGTTDWSPDQEYSLVEIPSGSHVDIGYLYDGSTFTKPEQSSPPPEDSGD